MTAFEKAFEGISKLAKDFEANLDFYMAANYQEYEVRNRFINKFFIILGWDVLGDENSNPYEQEVKVEKAQKQQGSRAQKRADYAFYKVPNYKDVEFFVEAKKPSVELRSVDNYFQTIRYGWNAQTPIAVLTDFEQFHIIDCRIKPDVRFVFNGQHKEYRFTDYYNKEKFAEIYWLFSREAVLANSLEKYAKNLPSPKGKVSQTKLFKLDTQAIDESFLQYIDDIRENLAKAFKRNDDTLNGDQLTEAVQRTVDRLVFIRFLEDKLIEGESHVNEWRGWADFVADCRRLNAKYNGIVFKKHFIDDQEFTGPDEKVFRDICQDISSLNSPYDFNYIPIHILGSIYERFLGKVVVTTAKRVHIDDKPEVRKAGGVYYTPKYVVDYIVKQTIGSIIADKAPKDIDQLRFADIACGSGSFLIGVYDFLLDYHKKYYLEKYKNKTDIDKKSLDYANIELRNGQWVMTLKRKQEILHNNIFGIDIDAQAVEVTQLSLFLKMLEDESLSSTNVRQGSMFSKVLPDLSKNIICGNSLVSFDVFGEDLFPDDDIMKNNPLDYSTTFPAIMSKGGFNAIVGNPPWVDIKGLDPFLVDYYFKKFQSSANRINLYALFIEMALTKIRKNGVLGYIIPNSILYQSSYKKLRELILGKFNLSEIVRMPDNVFKNVKAETAILIMSNEKTLSTVNAILFDRNAYISDITDDESKEVRQIDSKTWKDHDLVVFDIYANEGVSKILAKIEFGNDPLDKFCDFCLGLTPYDKYKGHTPKQIEQRAFHSTEIKDKTFKKLLEGANIERYRVSNTVREYISYGNWLGAPREQKFFTEPRILVRQIVSGKPLRIYAGYTNEELYNTQSIFNLLQKKGSGLDLKFILAVLNSTLMNFYHGYKYLDMSKNLFQKILIQNCKKFPIADIDLKNASQKAKYENIISKVNRMLEAKENLGMAKTEKDSAVTEHLIQSLDGQIDQLVFDLYGLNEEEISIIREKYH